MSGDREHGRGSCLGSVVVGAKRQRFSKLAGAWSSRSRVVFQFVLDKLADAALGALAILAASRS